MERRRKVWMNGFRAGQALLRRCPYPPGSADARDWLEGGGDSFIAYLSLAGAPAHLRIKGVKLKELCGR